MTTKKVVISIRKIDKIPAESFFSRAQYCVTVDETVSITYQGGTQVLTDRGSIPIEDLKVTDKILCFIKS